MKGMVFAAGLGTRLKPLTDTIPKALAPLQGNTLLGWNLLKLKKAGVTEVVVNVHHFADKVRAYLNTNSFGLRIHISDESDLLLETGGGLKKAAGFFQEDEDVFVVNADVICDLDLNALLKHHQSAGNLATLTVMKRESSRYFLFDKEYRLSGWENRSKNELRIVRDKPPFQSLAFSGIQVVSGKLPKMIRQEGVFSLVDVYLDLAPENRIEGHLHGGKFLDLGTLEKLEAAEKDEELFVGW